MVGWISGPTFARICMHDLVLVLFLEKKVSTFFGEHCAHLQTIANIANGRAALIRAADHVLLVPTLWKKIRSSWGNWPKKCGGMTIRLR